MEARQRLEAVFVENLPLVDRIVASLCRRHGLHGDEADDFGSWVKERMMEGDYAVLGKFRGESAIATYLTMVIAMMLREYRVRRWGRWRPSAAARRHGDIAVRLEVLVHRQGHRLREAIQLLQLSGETRLSERELVEIFSRLPRRTPLRPVEVGPTPLADIAVNNGADQLVNTTAANAERAMADRALKEALDALPSEDRLILRMKFWQGLSVAEIARALHLPQKPLYRRIEHALAVMRPTLETAGISAAQANALLEEALP
jgi:RNA polymerase sigma factor for flagellar operon FliA